MTIIAEAEYESIEWAVGVVQVDKYLAVSLCNHYSSFNKNL